MLKMHLFGLCFCRVLNVIRFSAEVFFWYTEHLCGLNFVAVLPCCTRNRKVTIVYCDFTRVQEKVWMTHCYKAVLGLVRRRGTNPLVTRTLSGHSSFCGSWHKLVVRLGLGRIKLVRNFY
jgi:hypothetical protein